MTRWEELRDALDDAEHERLEAGHGRAPCRTGCRAGAAVREACGILERTGSVAQRIEQQASNLPVGGSIPSGPVTASPATFEGAQRDAVVVGDVGEAVAEDLARLPGRARA